MKKLWVLGALSAILILVGCGKTDIPENRVHSINDLSNKKVGVQIGNTAETYAADFGGDTAKIQVERYKTLEDAVQALRQGELDAVLCDDAPANVFARRNPSLRILDEAFVEEDYAGIVAKQNWGLLDTVNMALIQMRAMGIYDSIFSHYIGGASEYHYEPKEKAEGPALRLATNAEFPPYEFHADSGVVKGIDIEIARYLADFMERPLEIIDMGFDSIIDAVSTGKADIGLAAFSVTEERERIISFTDHYAKSKIVVLVRSGQPESTFQRIKDTLFGS
jgi:polar amino acid transport system substrate-binding protein